MPSKYHFVEYTPKALKYSNYLRRNMTRQEKRLWYDFLRTFPVKFYRQKPIGKYIADFYCSRVKLVIELDGSQHYSEDAMEYDKVRSDAISSNGIRVLRYTNPEIDRDFDGVCRQIRDTVQMLIEMGTTDEIQ